MSCDILLRRDQLKEIYKFNKWINGSSVGAKKTLVTIDVLIMRCIIWLNNGLHFSQEFFLSLVPFLNVSHCLTLLVHR